MIALNNALKEALKNPEAFNSIVESLQSNLKEVGEKAINKNKKDLPTILNTMENLSLIENLKAKIPKEVSKAGANTEAGTVAENPGDGTKAGETVLVEGGGRATWYNADLGGINGNGDGIVATGEKFDPNKITAAAFPELLERLPQEYTRPAKRFRGGITLAREVKLLVETETGKKVILSLNDVGPGVEGHEANHYLDLSPAARDALGAPGNISGLRISIAPDNSTPGVIM